MRAPCLLISHRRFHHPFWPWRLQLLPLCAAPMVESGGQVPSSFRPRHQRLRRNDSGRVLGNDGPELAPRGSVRKISRQRQSTAPTRVSSQHPTARRIAFQPSPTLRQRKWVFSRRHCRCPAAERIGAIPNRLGPGSPRFIALVFPALRSRIVQREHRASSLIIRIKTAFARASVAFHLSAVGAAKIEKPRKVGDTFSQFSPLECAGRLVDGAVSAACLIAGRVA
jgi:hypothetical protein